MYIECPECKKNNYLEYDDLPDRACEDEDYECKFCQFEFKIGWRAEAELR